MDEGLQFPVRSKNSTRQREGNPKTQGVPPVMAYMVRLHPKGVPFYQREENLQLEICKNCRESVN